MTYPDDCYPHDNDEDELEIFYETLSNMHNHRSCADGLNTEVFRVSRKIKKWYGLEKLYDN